VFDEVVCLYTIFDEEIVPFYSVSNIPSHMKEMHAVKSDNPGHGIMNCISYSIWLWNVSSHVEMHAISTDDL